MSDNSGKNLNACREFTAKEHLDNVYSSRVKWCDCIKKINSLRDEMIDLNYHATEEMRHVCQSWLYKDDVFRMSNEFRSGFIKNSDFHDTFNKVLDMILPQEKLRNASWKNDVDVKFSSSCCVDSHEPNFLVELVNPKSKKVLSIYVPIQDKIEVNFAKMEHNPDLGKFIVACKVEYSSIIFNMKIAKLWNPASVFDAVDKYFTGQLDAQLANSKYLVCDTQEVGNTHLIPSIYAPYHFTGEFRRDSDYLDQPVEMQIDMNMFSRFDDIINDMNSCYERFNDVMDGIIVDELT